jgi:NAD(P)-dependent dehydrogenase (short-subunit alcohol dehydrogenase family)
MQIEKHAGTIINIGSKLGLERIPAEPVYSAAKHGLRGWSHNCHEALRTKGIKVTLINPGTRERGDLNVWQMMQGGLIGLRVAQVHRDAAASFAPGQKPRHTRSGRSTSKVAAAFDRNAGCRDLSDR